MEEEDEKTELERPYDFGKVSTKTEIIAGWFGKEDDMIIEYLKRFPNPRGANLPHLILYFTYKYGLMGQRRLMRRLRHLIKMNIIMTKEEAGITFYKLVIEEPESINKVIGKALKIIKE